MALATRDTWQVLEGHCLFKRLGDRRLGFLGIHQHVLYRSRVG
jgi:hypothetical protein